MWILSQVQLWGTLECVGSGPAFSMELLRLIYPKHTGGYKSRYRTSGCTLANHLEGKVAMISVSTFTTCVLSTYSRERFSVSIFVPSPKISVFVFFFFRFLWSVTLTNKQTNKKPEKKKKKKGKNKKQPFLHQGKTEFSPDIYANRNLNLIIIMNVDNEILPTTFISFLILMPLST